MGRSYENPLWSESVYIDTWHPGYTLAELNLLSNSASPLYSPLE